MSLGAPELLILLVVVLLLFGAKKVPDLARSLGQAKREFEDGADEAPRPAVVEPVIVEPVRPVADQESDIA
jgi:sec-independent protein translocase protein TatA